MYVNDGMTGVFQVKAEGEVGEAAEFGNGRKPKGDDRRVTATGTCQRDRETRVTR